MQCVHPDPQEKMAICSRDVVQPVGCLPIMGGALCSISSQQSVKCLFYKQEGLSVIPQNPGEKSQAWWHLNINSDLGEFREKNPRGLLHSI